MGCASRDAWHTAAVLWRDWHACRCAQQLPRIACQGMPVLPPILHSGRLTLQCWCRRPSRGRCGVWLVLLGFNVKLVGFIARSLPGIGRSDRAIVSATGILTSRYKILPCPCPCVPRCGCWRQLLESRRSLSLPYWLSSYAWPRGSRRARGSGRHGIWRSALQRSRGRRALQAWPVNYYEAAARFACTAARQCGVPSNAAY